MRHLCSTAVSCAVLGEGGGGCQHPRTVDAPPVCMYTAERFLNPTICVARTPWCNSFLPVVLAHVLVGLPAQ